MRWLVVFVFLLPLAAPAASVLLVPTDEKARVLAEELVEPFGAQKLTVKTAGAGSPAVSCLKAKDRVPCLTALGEKAKVIAVFVVSGAMKGAKGVLTLELIADGKVLKKDSTKVNKGKVKAQLRGPVERLLAMVPRASDEPAAAPVRAIVTDTPKEPEPPAVATTDVPKKEEPQLTAPQPQPDPLALQQPLPKQSKPKVGAAIVTGLAVAAAGAAATFGALGMTNKAQLETAPNGVSALSYAEATQLQQTSNTQLTVALGAGIGAGVAGVVAAILWGVE
jgi:hypothetical protein